jgi:superfamily II DNA or RNA helicase
MEEEGVVEAKVVEAFVEAKQRAKVDLTDETDEKKIYVGCSIKIRNISGYLHTSDPKSITSLLRRGGRSAGLAKTWFSNVKERKNLINCAKNKLLAAVDIIATKHTSERIMVFSETIESIEKLKEMLQNKAIKSMLIDSKLNSKKRQIILSEWGKEFFPLLSVHTLEIGYDVPEVRVAIILATSSNRNQIVQLMFYLGLRILPILYKKGLDLT